MNNQQKIMLDTLKKSILGVSLMGGPTHKEAIAYLLKNGYTKEKLIKLLKQYKHTDTEIKRMFN